MPIIANKKLYEEVKNMADTIYKKSSAYKSGWIVKKYKELGGKYKDDNKEKKLKRWFKEDWKDIGNKDYPVYRPTKRATKDTPLTFDEIDKNQLKQQIELKQKIKGEKNLPKFKKEGTGKKIAEIIKRVYLGRGQNKEKSKKVGKYTYFLSDKPKKKLMTIIDGKKIYFGATGYEHFRDKTGLLNPDLQHFDNNRRNRYIMRATNIKDKDGNYTQNNPLSPNYHALNILW